MGIICCQSYEMGIVLMAIAAAKARGVYRDSGKQNGNYYCMLGLYRDNDYYSI